MAFSCRHTNGHSTGTGGTGWRDDRERTSPDVWYGVRRLLLPLAVFIQLCTCASESMAVGGISGSKLVVPEAATVPKGHIEAEPFFSLEFIDDENDTVRYGGGFRLTMGILENLEAGVNINYLDIEDSGLISAETNFGDIESGFKLRFIDQGAGLPFSLAYQAGVTFPAGKGAQWIVEPGGLILTKEFTEKLSIDADFVFALVEHGSWSFAADAGVGYYLNSWFQPVIEAAYAYEDEGSRSGVSVINVSAGFTADVTDCLTIVLGATPDVYTENTEKEVVVTSAFTFAF